MDGKDSSFSPLDKTTQQIRIVILHPGEGNQTVVCEHKTVSLQQPGDFEALSYCWGSDIDQPEIVLNGTPYRIRLSLDIALRYLRSKNDTRSLWIDALCINQGENEEKLHQVAQMRSIYEAATQVLVWLGPPAENNDSAYDLIEDVATKTSLGGSLGRDMETSKETSLAAFSGILELFSRPYWHRIWIIQEIAVASKEPIVGCGARWLPWWMILRAAREVHIGLSTANSMKKRMASHPFQDYSDARFLPGMFIDINNIRSEVQKEPENATSIGPETYFSRPWTNLLELLNRTRHAEASDPRDCVYALRGLFRFKFKHSLELEAILTPDYWKSHWRVYCEVTQMAMEKERNLEILQYKNHSNCVELPSWVPDFSKHWSQTYPTLGPWHDWSASGPLRVPGEPRFRISSDLQTLHAQGASLDSIKRVVDMHTIDTDFEDAIRKVHNAVFDSVDGKSDPRSPSNFYAVDAIWRSLMGNRSAENTLPAPAGFRALYLSSVEEFPIASAPSHNATVPNIKPFKDSVLSAIRQFRGSSYRRFIISEGGLLGSGPPDCQRGDSICILFGYKMPVILRPLGRCYRLVGSAYVHGRMNGEGVPSFESGSGQRESFNIR